MAKPSGLVTAGTIMATAQMTQQHNITVPIIATIHLDLNQLRKS